MLDTSQEEVESLQREFNWVLENEVNLIFFDEVFYLLKTEKLFSPKSIKKQE